jgi:hypothetical protein
LLDDTVVREFLLQEYPRLVNAEAFVSEDLREAQDAVRGSLRRAWDRDDAGSPVEPLANWVLIDVMGRWGRRRRSLRRAWHRGVSVEGVLSGLARREREVASLCLYLRRSPPEAAHILGMREGELERLLAETRRTLARSLPPTDHERPEMELDDALERWLASIERPVPIDGVFDRILRTRVRGARGRRAVTLVLSLALVVGVAAGFWAASSPAPPARARPSATPAAPALDPPPPDATSVPGTPFLACDVTRLVSDFEDVHGVEGAYVFRHARRRGPCSPANVATTQVALVRADRLVSVTLSGPIQCYPTCRVFSAPVFGAGPALLAIAVTSGDPADAVELYRASEGRSGTALTRIATVVSGKRIPVAFDWGGVGIYRLGADCAGPSHRKLDIWTAVLRRGRWMVQQQVAALHGSRLGAARILRSSVRSVAELPSGGRGEFCGAPVRR